MLYRDYMANLSMYTVNNLANYFGGEKVTKTFMEILNPLPEEKRSAEEIIENIKLKLNGVRNERI